ncbi:MAG: hypothetical protein M5U01_21895 [Ardenticatenaceae bacterium]|nr:hypothetical protein [Ardenticatenaceae bacterium]
MTHFRSKTGQDAIALNSWPGIIEAVLATRATILLNGNNKPSVQEERMLRAELPGYGEYMADVKYRFIPYW